MMVDIEIGFRVEKIVRYIATAEERLYGLQEAVYRMGIAAVLAVWWNPSAVGWTAIVGRGRRFIDKLVDVVFVLREDDRAATARDLHP